MPVGGTYPMPNYLIDVYLLRRRDQHYPGNHGQFLAIWFAVVAARPGN